MVGRHFLPECYFDTVLIKMALRMREKDRVNHKKGCNNVVKAMKDGELSDVFAVGIVDRDKRELDYLREFHVYEYKNLKLHKHLTRPHYVIQLDPPLEEWILRIADEGNVDVLDYGLTTDINKLKKITKSELAEETAELQRLCRALINSNSQTITRLCNWLNYFKEKQHQSDIKELINV